MIIKNNKKCNITINDKKISNKSAKEMFEELGWYLDIETNDEQIVYSKNKFNNDTFGFIGAKTISFDKEMESIYLDEINDISMLLLQAINKQIQELNWEVD